MSPDRIELSRSQLRWRGISVDPYPAMMYVGMVAGVWAGSLVAKTKGLPAVRTYIAILLLLAPAVFGARLLFVARHWPVFRADPRRIWQRSDGGLALYGGLALALITSLPLLAVLRLPVAAFWDVGAVVILVGMVFTKIGCHLTGCCAGRVTEGRLALRLPNARGIVARRIPSQLLESALAALLLGAALLVAPTLPFDGALFLFALLGYSLGRLLLEPTRESIDRVGSVSVNRAISTCLAVLAAITLFVSWNAAGPRGEKTNARITVNE